MPLLLRIALRNLGEHKIKSIIVAGLIALGMFLLILSSSVIETAKAGIERTFIKGFSGHILVGPPSPSGAAPNLFPGSGFSMDMTLPATVPAYPQVLEALEQWPGVVQVSPQVFAMAQVQMADTWMAYLGAFAYDQAKYKAMFPDNLRIIEGQDLLTGETGMLLPNKLYRDFRYKAMEEFLPALRQRFPVETTGLSDLQVKEAITQGAYVLLAAEQQILDSATIKVGDSLRLVAFGSGTRIKRVPVRGIYEFSVSNTAIDDFAMLDLDSARYLMGLVVGAATPVVVPAEAVAFLADDWDSDDFFANDSLQVLHVATQPTSLTAYDNLLGDMDEARDLSRSDSGAWHYMVLRLADGVDVASTIVAMNQWFVDQGIGVQAVNWEGAAGNVATLIVAVQAMINVLIIMIACISLFIIMNTMVASIIERTGEIGTMRALGAQKSFVRRLFLTETFILSGLGGTIGLVLGTLVIAILHATGLPAGHELLQMAFGGKVLYPVLSLGSVAGALAIIMSVAWLSSLYPTALALKVSPLKAMQS
jgi:putative ABC transport system permease protein